MERRRRYSRPLTAGWRHAPTLTAHHRVTITCWRIATASGQAIGSRRAGRFISHRLPPAKTNRPGAAHWRHDHKNWAAYWLRRSG